MPLHHRVLSRIRAKPLCSGPWPSCYPHPGLIHKALGRGVQAVVRGGARCASQVLDRGTQADARGAMDVLGRGVQAVARDAARCALHVNGRGANADACGRSLLHVLGRSAKTDAFGRSFEVLSTQVSAAGLAQQADVWHHA